MVETATVRAGAIAVGDRLPDLVSAPITRTTLALFAGASGDHNPIHVDIDFARAAGMPDVFAHGMLSMAYLARLLTRWAPQGALRRWEARFVAITPVKATVTCSGEVVALFEEAGEQRARLRIAARIDDGQDTMIGEAVIAIR